MIGYYTPVIVLQAFCLYHAYKNNNDRKWFWIIVFFPLFGGLIYLYDSFYSKKNISSIAEGLSEGLKTSINPNRKIDKLEKELQISDSVANRIHLADEYIVIQEYERATELLESCLEGIHRDDVEILMKLVKVHYLNQQYQQVIHYGEQLLTATEFKNSEEKVALAWSYKELNRLEQSHQQFEEVDARFSNYPLRIEYARFLEETKGTASAMDKLDELLTEIDSMGSNEKKHKKQIYRTVKKYYSELAQKAKLENKSH